MAVESGGFNAGLTRWHERWNGDPIDYFTKKYEDVAGLGNTQPGDGYLFRGRGPLQVTGRDAYTRIGNRLGLDLVANPDSLDDPANHPEIGFRAAAAFWTYYKGPGLFGGDHPNILAEQVTLSSIVEINRRITKVVQGGYGQEPLRLNRYYQALHVFGVI